MLILFNIVVLPRAGHDTKIMNTSIDFALESHKSLMELDAIAQGNRI
jgi:hypothetical protein